MNQSNMYFISGITGHVGGAAAGRLLEDGHQIRTLVRDPAKAAAWSEKGVDVRQGDLNDAAAVAASLEGVAGAFLMIPPILAPSPGYTEAKAVIASYMDALRRTPPPRLVALSSFGSERASGLGNITTTHLMEEAFRELSLPTAFVRAGGFFENYIPGLGVAKATGISYSFYAPLDRPLPMIATEDIGVEVASLLTGESWTGVKIVELGSPVTPAQIAAAMQQTLGRPVEAQAIPRERWAATLESFGMRPGTTAAYEEMIDGINSGWIAFGAPGAEVKAGTLTAADVFRRAL